MANIKQVDAAGAVTTTPTLIYSVVLTAGEDDATAELKESSAGETYLSLKAAGDSTVQARFDGAQLQGLYVAMSGTGPVVTVEYAHA